MDLEREKERVGEGYHDMSRSCKMVMYDQEDDEETGVEKSGKVYERY